MEKYDVGTKKPIGRGAFGSVYLYQRKSDCKEIVIKQITIDDLTTDQRKAVMNEISVSEMLTHPNIVKYLEYFIEENAFMIVMDYAPGGNLYDYLQKRHSQKYYLEEEEVIRYFVQIVRALHHIHNHNVLHRDMKTHNILLDATQKVLKICDFGISKCLTQTNAMTTVGTVHYMSPEVVEGKAYNKKSDVWSMGCILYELMTLKRAFDGSPLSAILWKIVNCDYTPMAEHYSEELKRIVKDILTPDSAKRPELTHILASPVLINQLFDLETYIGRIQPCSYGGYRSNHRKKSKKSISGHSSKGYSDDSIDFTDQLKSVGLDDSDMCTSVYYWTSCYTSALTYTPIVLPVRGTDQFITQVCVGRTKKLGLTSKGRVIMWENTHSGRESSTGAWNARNLGKFSGSNIAQVSCGDHFIVVRSVRGMLMTWGSGEHGCLGHGTTSESSKAKVVEDLVGCTVVDVSCGAAHVMALTSDQKVYVWGKGSSGNLGLNDREDRLRPTLVPLPPDFHAKSIICGHNYSFIITSDSKVFACGNNRKNKLALLTNQELDNCSSDLLPSQDYLVLTEITCHPIANHAIVDIGAGPSHTAFLSDTGLVFTAGSNKHSQLGYTQKSSNFRPAPVCMLERSISFIGCGDRFTVAISKENKVYCWGGEQEQEQERGEKLTVVPIDSTNLKFHSLSVCHNSTLLVGEVINQA